MSSMMDFYSGLTFLLVGAFAILMNFLLVGIVLGIRERRRELNLSLGLAVVDIVHSGTVILTIGYVLIVGKHPTLMDESCKIKGPVAFLTIFLSMLLAAIIARVRCSVVLGKSIHAIEYVLLAMYVTFYCSLTGWVTYQDGFVMAPSRVDCAPDARGFLGAKLNVFFLGFSLVLFSLVAIACYLTIIWFLVFRHQPALHANDQPKSTSVLIPKRRRFYRPVVLRTLAACLMYLLFSVPAGTFMMLEATVTLPTTNFLSLAISVCVLLSAVSNPCLILFAHSLIYGQLTRILTRRFQRARDFFNDPHAVQP